MYIPLLPQSAQKRFSPVLTKASNRFLSACSDMTAIPLSFSSLSPLRLAARSRSRQRNSQGCFMHSDDDVGQEPRRSHSSSRKCSRKCSTEKKTEASTSKGLAYLHATAPPTSTAYTWGIAHTRSRTCWFVTPQCCSLIKQLARGVGHWSRTVSQWGCGGVGARGRRNSQGKFSMMLRRSERHDHGS